MGEPITMKNDEPEHAPYSDDRPFDPAPGTSWAKLLTLVPQGARVLDVGCAFGQFSAAMRRLRACRVTGIEINPQAAEAARTHCDEVFTGDVIQVVPDLPQNFDVIVAADVLEHLVDPVGALQLLSSKLRRGGIILASIPNITHLSVLLSLAEGRFPRSEEGLLDKTHLQFFGEADVLALFHSAGLAARVADKVRTEPGSTEFRNDILGLPVEVLSFLSRHPNSDTYQFIVRAVPRAWAGNGDDQTAPPPMEDAAGLAVPLRAELERLRRELHERGVSAGSIDAELRKTQADFQRLRAEFEERTAWALSASAAAAAAAKDADRERAAATESARRAAELEEAVRQAEQRQAELEEAVRQAKQRQAELEKHAAHLQHLLDGTASRRMRRLARRGLHAALKGAMAAAAVPVAVVLGAAAVVLDGLAALKPRPRSSRPARTQPPLATIQILNYEGRELLERNLPSVLAAVAHTGHPHEVLVVDNGSTDGSVEMLREKFPGVTVVPLDRNYFFSRGNNQGAPHARGDVLVLLNNDMRVEPDFLAPLLAPFDDPDVFAVSSQIFFPPGPKKREETGLTRARFAHGMLEYSHDPVPAGARGLIPILWGGGGSCAFDKAKWDELRGLDEMYDPFYCEDLDLSLRAWQRGWKVFLAPESKVWHEHRATSRRFFGETFVNETFRRNSYLLHWKNLRAPSLLASHLFHLPFLVARDVDRHGRSGARSFLKAVRRAPRALLQRLGAPAHARSQVRLLEDTNLAAPDVLFREPKKLREGAPLRITLVTPYHFWPIEHGGAVRMYHVARELARRGHEISVVGFVDTDEQLEGARHLETFCAEVCLLKRGPPEPRRDWGSIPTAALHFDKPELHRALNGLIARRDPDVIQIEYAQLAGYGRQWPRAAVCLTEHDVAFVSHYRQTHQEPRLKHRAESHIDYLRLFRYELEALRRFDLVLTVSEADAKILRGYLGSAVHLSASGRIGVDEERYGSLTRRPDANRLLFVGFFQHRPNTDAMLWFAREVLPLIHARRPEVRVDLVGKEPPPEIRKLADDSRLTVHGFVPDLAPHYASASIFIAPVRGGSGVRVKLLEAFSAGMPVVATPAAAEGLVVTDGQELALAGTAQAFAERVLSLLDHPAEAEALGQRARSFVHEKHGWAPIAAELEAEYRAALRRKGLVQ